MSDLQYGLEVALESRREGGLTGGKSLGTRRGLPTARARPTGKVRGRRSSDPRHPQCRPTRNCSGWSFAPSLNSSIVGSTLSVREPTSFQHKEETRWLPTTNPRTRCDAATSSRRSGRTSARKVRSSQQPSPARSRISLGNGAIALRSVSMTSKRLSSSPVMPRSGLPLTS